MLAVLGVLPMEEIQVDKVPQDKVHILENRIIVSDSTLVSDSLQMTFIHFNPPAESEINVPTKLYILKSD